MPQIHDEWGDLWTVTLTETEAEADPNEVEPPHEVRDAGKLASLRASMEAHGWQGRPILASLSPAGLQAHTGSHRIAAARLAGLGAIPVIVIEITEERAGAEGADEAPAPRYDAYGRLDLGMDDADRVSALSAWDLPLSLRLMRAEGD